VEADAGHEIHEATTRGLVLTGRIITSAGLILAGTFAALMLAPLPNLRQIGFGVTVGILIDTFIVRSLLVPSATILLHRWAFWPSKLGRQPPTEPTHENAPTVLEDPVPVGAAPGRDGR
jgi:RND superfamily putative drug exporter